MVWYNIWPDRVSKYVSTRCREGRPLFFVNAGPFIRQCHANIIPTTAGNAFDVLYVLSYCSIGFLSGGGGGGGGG